MHRCLQVPEIISLICIEISGDKPLAITSHTSLAALAQTCKFFQDPALDELWKAQSSLKPLLRCFPADALAKDKQGRLLFYRPLERRDWSRVLFYAPRIKVLTSKINTVTRQFPAPEYDFADISVWQMLAISKPPSLKHFLPNLRSLAWHESQDATSPFIILLLAPTVTHLDFWTKTTAAESPLLLSVVPSLHELCPLLEHIQLLGQTTPTGIRIVSEMVSQWNSLRQIDIDTLNPRALLHLANMPTLEILRIWGAYQLGEVRWTGDELFPVLRQLILRNPNMT
ncbi:hypothetical protein Hypma_016479 [Hypsizygus marmoreus]|uniref:F-box domain-containing protein n=1 Tax=Hypsizygus marmoreus TaxID=39966 RepID=A0A369J5S6_HYPMA|nr:hypothetical protein Hypma_016479 [Hypsizygus marmoreus]